MVAGVTPRGALAGVVLAAAVGAAVALQNHAALAAAGRDVPWGRLFANELLVWGAWALLAPLVFALARRFPPRLAPRPLLAHALAAPLVVLASFVPVTAAHAAGLFPHPGPVPFVAALLDTYRRYVVLFLMVYALLVAGERAVANAREAQARRLSESRLEALLGRARLDHLRAQLQPHFLFNALHAISGLMQRDVAGARRMIARLSDLLRLSLDERGGHLVPLERELELLDVYVDLQRLRFPDRLRVEVEVEDAARAVRVPKLLLQPLVENAVRHGVEPRAGPGGGAEVAIALPARAPEEVLA